ncbi:hypothetical protein I6F07_23895 [Ensifer sp. IC4062]|nr:hypothetical protein [Ensifer sp. IC4062]
MNGSLFDCQGDDGRITNLGKLNSVHYGYRQNETQAARLRSIDGFPAALQTPESHRCRRRVGPSQSAVSHAIGRLRDVFEDPLFTRLPDGFMPNPTAYELAPLIDEIVNAANEALGAGGFEPKTSMRLFQVTTVDYVAALLAPALRAALVDEAPGVRFSLRFGAGQTALDHVRTDEVDLAIGRFDLLPDGYRASPCPKTTI